MYTCVPNLSRAGISYGFLAVLSLPQPAGRPIPISPPGRSDSAHPPRILLAKAKCFGEIAAGFCSLSPDADALHTLPYYAAAKAPVRGNNTTYIVGSTLTNGGLMGSR